MTCLHFSSKKSSENKKLSLMPIEQATLLNCFVIKFSSEEDFQFLEDHQFLRFVWQMAIGKSSLSLSKSLSASVQEKKLDLDSKEKDSSSSLDESAMLLFQLLVFLSIKADKSSHFSHQFQMIVQDRLSQTLSSTGQISNVDAQLIQFLHVLAVAASLKKSETSSAIHSLFSDSFLAILLNLLKAITFDWNYSTEADLKNFKVAHILLKILKLTLPSANLSKILPLLNQTPRKIIIKKKKKRKVKVKKKNLKVKKKNLKVKLKRMKMKKKNLLKNQKNPKNQKPEESKSGIEIQVEKSKTFPLSSIVDFLDQIAEEIIGKYYFTQFVTLREKQPELEVNFSLKEEVNLEKQGLFVASIQLLRTLLSTDQSNSLQNFASSEMNWS